MFVVETNAIGSNTEEATEAKKRQVLSAMKAENIEKMLEEVEEKE